MLEKKASLVMYVGPMRYHGKPCAVDWNPGIGEDDGVLHVRAVPAGQVIGVEVGTDISLFPYHLSGCRVAKPGGFAILEDAQGEHLETSGRRSACHVKVSTLTLW